MNFIGMPRFSKQRDFPDLGDLDRTFLRLAKIAESRCDVSLVSTDPITTTEDRRQNSEWTAYATSFSLAELQSTTNETGLKSCQEGLSLPTRDAYEKTNNNARLHAEVVVVYQLFLRIRGCSQSLKCNGPLYSSR